MAKQESHKNNKTKTLKPPFYRRRAFLLSVGSVIGVVVVILLAFRLSPWPGAFLIRQVFESDGAKVKQIMQPYAPSGVTKLADQHYDSTDTSLKLDAYYPSRRATEHLPVIIWTHGGAWISGDKTDAEPYFRLLASKGYAVVSINYTLAPFAKYPTQIKQLNKAHQYIEANAARLHIDQNNVFLAGDSAGSQLSAEMAALITNPKYANDTGVTPSLKPAQLKGVLLNCGIYRMEGLTQPNPTLPKIVGWGNDVAVWSFAGTRDFSSPIIRQMSPYYYLTKDFPPTYITGGNADPLTGAQSRPFADELGKLGVEVSQLFYSKDHKPALPHEYQFRLNLTDAQRAMDAMLSFVTEHTK
jgi:acetyl esterase